MADPESLDISTLADDLAGIYVAVKEGLLSIPEHAERVPGFVIWNWTFGLETDAGRHAVYLYQPDHGKSTPARNWLLRWR